MDKQSNPSDAPCSIGQMRERVSFGNVTDVIDPVSKRSVQSFAYSGEEWACIRPSGTQMFFDNIDTNNEVSHIIYTRWRPDGATYQYIVQRIIPPGAEDYIELKYEVVRSTSWNGFRVFSRFDVKLLSEGS
jgi:hypothetical protein